MYYSEGAVKLLGVGDMPISMEFTILKPENSL